MIMPTIRFAEDSGLKTEDSETAVNKIFDTANNNKEEYTGQTWKSRTY